MLSLKQLITPATEEETLEEILGILSEFGFQTTSWQSGSVQLTLVRLFARVFSSLTENIRGQTQGMFTRLSQGEFLTLLARHVFDLERLEATPTIGQIRLTSSAGAPVHTWSAGEIIVATAEEEGEGVASFSVSVSGSLNPGQSALFEFQSNIPGEIGNIPPNVPLFLWTSTVGVTATNPVVTGTNTWVTTPGTDEEQDSRLQDRCVGRWHRLSYGNTDGAYRAWALEALPSLTRLTIRAAAGDGRVQIVGATSLGGLDAAQIQTIEDHINGVDDGVGRRPINDILVVESAVEKTDEPVDATVFVQSEARQGITARIVETLLAYFGSIPIGGVSLQSPDTGFVLFSKIIDVIHNVDGVRSVDLTSPSNNVLLNTDEIYAPSISIAVVEVQ